MIRDAIQTQKCLKQTEDSLKKILKQEIEYYITYLQVEYKKLIIIKNKLNSKAAQKGLVRLLWQIKSNKEQWEALLAEVGHKNSDILKEAVQIQKKTTNTLWVLIKIFQDVCLDK